MKAADVPIPTRVVETQWGSLYAQGLSPDWVRFATYIGGGAMDAHHLVLKRFAYRADLALYRRGSEEGSMVSLVPVDDTWGAELRSISTRVRRLDGAPPTPLAEQVMREEVMPALAVWLNSSEGGDLIAGAWERERQILLRVADKLSATLRWHADDAQRARLTFVAVPSGEPVPEGERSLIRQLQRDTELLDMPPDLGRSPLPVRRPATGGAIGL